MLFKNVGAAGSQLETHAQPVIVKTHHTDLGLGGADRAPWRFIPITAAADLLTTCAPAEQTNEKRSSSTTPTSPPSALRQPVPVRDRIFPRQLQSPHPPARNIHKPGVEDLGQRAPQVIHKLEQASTAKLQLHH